MVGELEDADPGSDLRAALEGEGLCDGGVCDRVVERPVRVTLCKEDVDATLMAGGEGAEEWFDAYEHGFLTGLCRL